MLNSQKIVANIFFACSLFLFACENQDNKKKENLETPKLVLQKTPDFRADSAYYFVEKQVSFGKRVPNTKSHLQCGNYLVSTLKRFGWQVVEQPFDALAFDNKVLKSRNIIASWQPQASKRILLAAHWDSRPFADQDADKTKQKEPIDGANDGGSGVAVLLEIARTVAANQAIALKDVGIDLIFFDSEDYGQPEGTPAAEYKANMWCLGSQHWAKNKHKENYSAYFGILLDMVGGKNAKFHKEGQSMKYAPTITQTLWQTGQQLGYASYFVDREADAIIDDHVYVNEIAKIPMLDIIEYDNADGNYFNKHWHTQQDNLQNIDQQTLKAVGQTVLQVVYNEQSVN
jgi:glutaminyl-peptide cyclotransferase